MYNKCKVISELGCNHQGSIDTAKEMILQSKLAGADFIKLQKIRYRMKHKTIDGFKPKRPKTYF